MSDITSYMDKMKEFLKTKPDQVYVEKDGSAIYGLSGPDLDQVLVILPPDDKTYLDMTDEEINAHIVKMLS